MRLFGVMRRRTSDDADSGMAAIASSNSARTTAQVRDAEPIRKSRTASIANSKNRRYRGRVAIRLRIQAKMILRVRHVRTGDGAKLGSLDRIQLRGAVQHASNVTPARLSPLAWFSPGN